MQPLRNKRSWLVVASLLCAGCLHDFPPAGPSDAGPTSEAGPRPDRARDGAPAKLDQPLLLPDALVLACVGAATVGWHASKAGELAVCDGDPVDLCGAAARCGAGWHLCTPSEYASVFPSDGAPPDSETQSAWLAACVNPSGLAEGVCAAGCPAECSATSTSLATGCDGAETAGSEGCAAVGLVSAARCWRIGASGSGFWVPRPAYYGYNRSLCCRS